MYGLLGERVPLSPRGSHNSFPKLESPPLCRRIINFEEDKRRWCHDQITWFAGQCLPFVCFRFLCCLIFCHSVLRCLLSLYLIRYLSTANLRRSGRSGPFLQAANSCYALTRFSGIAQQCLLQAESVECQHKTLDVFWWFDGLFSDSSMSVSHPLLKLLKGDDFVCVCVCVSVTDLNPVNLLHLPILVATIILLIILPLSLSRPV